jgi:hypothetical protein
MLLDRVMLCVVKRASPFLISVNRVFSPLINEVG